jgi:thioredoxin reductase
MSTWQEIAAQFSLQIHTGERVEQVQKQGDLFTVVTSQDAYRARHVVLAMGRRGTPRRLGVQGEELPKVMYSLIDAQGYRNQHVLVVGGGDSAVEAAIGLARQPGNTVTISYRKTSFFRVKKKNEDRINQLIGQKKIRPIFESQVREISPDAVILTTPDGEYPLPNNSIFVFIGGVPPFDMLKAMGIQFGGKPKNLREEARPSKRATTMV